MTTLNETQRKHYDTLIRARDETAYCYHKFRSSCGVLESNNAARELAAARAHFTTAVTQLIESIRNEHANP